MKTIIKNKRSYRSKIGRLEMHDRNNQDPLNQTQAGGGASSIASGSGGAGSEAGSSSDDSDDSGKENNPEEDVGTSAGSAGTKRKVTRSGGSGRKGKQRKV
jgi:hypothetical protein